MDEFTEGPPSAGEPHPPSERPRPWFSAGSNTGRGDRSHEPRDTSSRAEPDPGLQKGQAPEPEPGSEPETGQEPGSSSDVQGLDGAGSVDGRWRNSSSTAAQQGTGGRSESVCGRWERGCRHSGPIGGIAGEVAAVVEDLGGADGLADEALADAVVGLARARSLLDAATAEFVARWDARCLWADDGSKAPGPRLARDVGCRPQTASRIVHSARASRSMPLVTAAWRSGTISTDHVERLSRARTPERAEFFPDMEAHLVSVAQNEPWPVFERAVAMFETAADDAGSDPTDPDDLKRRDKRERAHRNARPVQIGDRWQIVGSLDKIDGQVFANAWERIYQQLWEADLAEARRICGPDASAAEVTQAATDKRTTAQRSADALVEMATRAQTAPVDGQRPRPLISVVVSAGELFGPIRETFNGLVLSRLEVANLLFEADFERITFSTRGQPVEVSSPQRFFTGGWRRAVEVRDRVCQHPTCNVTAEFCQVDHIIEHSDGGQTSVDNGRLLCPKHNRQRPGRRRTNSNGNGSGKPSSTPGADDDGESDQPN